MNKMYMCLGVGICILNICVANFGWAATLHVRQDSTNPITPFSDWTTAASTIQDAIDAARPGDTVLVADGTYNSGGCAVYGLMNNRVALTKAIKVQSVNGPDVTIIVGNPSGTANGDGVFRCAYVGNNAVLSGFTLTGGHTRTNGDIALEQSGGGIWCQPNGVVTNCIVVNNTSHLNGGGAYGGILNNCILDGNRALYGIISGWHYVSEISYGYGGGAHSSILNHCSVRNNHSVNGGGVYESTVNNSMLSSNVAQYGAGAASSILYNSVLIFNDALFWVDVGMQSRPYGYGGGAHNSTLINCTVSGNGAANNGGGVYGGSMMNSIAYFNLLHSCSCEENYFNTTITNSCTTPLPGTGMGNIVMEPAFVDLSKGDVRLQSYSFCIDAGDDSVVTADWVDMEGKTRIQGKHVDMGAYEFPGLQRNPNTLFVWQDSPNPTEPYAGWATAAHTIQDAINAAEFGDIVLVTNGIYATAGRVVYGLLTNRIALNKPLLVKSVNGPEVTVIAGAMALGGATNGDGAVRCAYVGSNAVLSGFTLTNGHTRANGDYDREQSGGGVYCESGGTITNCILTGNSAALFGGGIIYGIVKNCKFVGNIAQYGGGAYSSLLNNSIFTRNYSEYDGGGTYGGKLTHCTLTGNATGIHGKGGGVYLGELFNSIVYFNNAQVDPNYSASIFLYSCTTPLPSGQGNVSADPLLTANLHLSTNSPCIGLGNIAYTSGVDLDGEPWSNPPSMGADQPVINNYTGPLSVTIVAAYTNVANDFLVDLSAQVLGKPNNISWSFGDGTTNKNQYSLKHSWSAPGKYEIRVTVFNGSNPQGVSASVWIRVNSRVRYVNVNNPSPAYPYDTWNIAAQTIQEAINAGPVPGTCVLVGAGTYDMGGMPIFGQMTNRVALTYPVTVQSVNGPELTSIIGATTPGGQTGKGAVRCAYVGSNAHLSGFTLSKGYTLADGDLIREQSGAGVWAEVGGEISNCIINDNWAANNGGGVYGGKMSNCTLIRNHALYGGGACRSALISCMLSNNSARWDGGGALESTLNNCTLITNLTRRGGGTFSSILNNCYLNQNFGQNDGGGMYECEANNCLLVKNNKNTSFSAWGIGGAFGGILKNCTLTGNSGGANNSLVYNSILAFNTTDQRLDYEGEASRISYSCGPSLPNNGLGNLLSEPMFRDGLNGDYRLATASPCIDAGYDRAVAADCLDLDGKPRIQGKHVDIGAYESEGFSFRTHSITKHIQSKESFQLLLSATDTNRLYRLQFKSDMAEPVWHAVTSWMQGNGSNVNLFDLVATNRQRFYRVESISR